VILLHLLLQPSSLPTHQKKKNSEKNKKTHQKIQKKKIKNETKKKSLRLSLDLLLLAVSIRIARDSCRAREIAEKCNQNAHENDDAAPQRNEAIAEPISIMAVVGVKGG
jgi:hypothetical protein